MRLTDAQKAFIIKQGEEGTPVAEICRKAGISQATYFNWKKKYAGMLPTDMKRLRESEKRLTLALDDETYRLRMHAAETDLTHQVILESVLAEYLKRANA